MNIQIWGYIRHLYFAERFPKKAIARELNLDPKTVRRALKKDQPDRKNPGPRPSKLFPFKEKIAELLASYPRMPCSSDAKYPLTGKNTFPIHLSVL